MKGLPVLEVLFILGDINILLKTCYGCYIWWFQAHFKVPACSWEKLSKNHSFYYGIKRLY